MLRSIYKVLSKSKDKRIGSTVSLDVIAIMERSFYIIVRLPTHNSLKGHAN